MKSLWISTAGFLLLLSTTWAQRDYILQEENGRVILIPKNRIQKTEQKKASAPPSEMISGGDIRPLPQSSSLQSPRPITSGITARSPFLPMHKTHTPETITQSGGATRPHISATSSLQAPLEAQGTNHPIKHNSTIEGISIEILSPKADEILKGNEALVFVRVSSYPISSTAFRVKAILNNGSPQVLDNIKKPFIFSNLPQGGHLLRIYLVKPNGRVVDDPGAFAMRRFYVGDKDFRNEVDGLSPLLTVNDPIEGRIEMDGQGLFWFDFLTRNAPVGEGAYGVRYRFNNVTSTVYSSKPIFWRGLREGRYQFTAELIDPDGALVPGPFNRVQREFDLKVNAHRAGIEITRENQLNSDSLPPSQERLNLEE
jgi:hypothetical protein